MGDVLTVLSLGGNALLDACLYVLGWLALGAVASGAALALLKLGQAAVRDIRGACEAVLPPPEPEVGDDTIAMLCLCCNGAKGDDCICTDDCGYPDCQAADPEGARNA